MVREADVYIAERVGAEPERSCHSCEGARMSRSYHVWLVLFTLAEFERKTQTADARVHILPKAWRHSDTLWTAGECMFGVFLVALGVRGLNVLPSRRCSLPASATFAFGESVSSPNVFCWFAHKTVWLLQLQLGWPWGKVLCSARHTCSGTSEDSPDSASRRGCRLDLWQLEV